MIRPLRQRHRRMVAVISVLLPVAFAAGIVVRKPAPTVAILPAALAMTPQHFEAVEWQRGDLFRKTAIQVRLLRDNTVRGHLAVAFSAPKDFLKPDLIVYWFAGIPSNSDTLLDNARLLGAFDQTTPLSLPERAGPESGLLVLYSLADQEIVETSKTFTLP